MNDFVKVFSIIQSHCAEQQGIFAHNDCFETVARQAGIPTETLELYLSLMQDFELLEYSMDSKYIRLTDYGKKVQLIIS